MEVVERFWGASVAEMKQGYSWDAERNAFYCLVCGEAFEEGEIFKHESSGRFYTAGKYAALHINEVHGSMLDYLLGLDKKATGLTDLQKLLVRGFAAELSDTALMERAGIGSASTIRNHRFVLKEKAKQAKLLLAVIELMEQGVVGQSTFVPVHATATQVDERYAMTVEEYESVLKQYFPDGPDGQLNAFPRKEKRKVAVLRHIASRLERGTKYTEKEMNELLKQAWAEDYVLLRRYLIEYGFVDRKDDCSAYWVKEAALGTEAEHSGILSIGEQAEKSTGLATKRSKVDAAGKPDKSGKTGKAEKQAKSGAAEKGVKGKGGSKMDKAQRKQLTAEYQERERSMGVYQIKNVATGKVYIGGSTNLEALWGREQFMLNMGSHQNQELQKDWKKYGSEGFAFLVLETVKFEHKLRYDYKDVLATEGREPAATVRQYNKEVAALHDKWLEKLQPYGEQGYNGPPGN